MPRGRKKNPEQPAESAEPTGAAPSIGHNAGPTPAIILDFGRRVIAKDTEIEDARKILSGLVGERRNVLKQAKKAGVNNDALLRQVANFKRNDPDGVLHDYRDELYYGQLFNMPLHQTDLFADDDRPEATEEQANGVDVFAARQQGHDAGVNGRPIEDCPYHQTEESECYQAWVACWHSGQAKLAAGLGGEVVGFRRGAGNPEDRPAA